jgi:hypothetical protein
MSDTSRAPRAVRTPCGCGHAHTDHLPERTPYGWAFTCRICSHLCRTIGRIDPPVIAEAEAIVRATVDRLEASSLHPASGVRRSSPPQRRLLAWRLRTIRRRFSVLCYHLAKHRLLRFAESGLSRTTGRRGIQALPHRRVRAMGDGIALWSRVTK